MNKKKKNRTRIECPIRFLYPTSDDWHPNFPRNTVEVRVYLYYNILWVHKRETNGMIRICIGGADDSTMERDEYLNESDYEGRLAEIRKWCEHMLPNPLTQAWLRTQGFQFA